MGIAAYNRGTEVIARQIPSAGVVAVCHPAAEPMPAIPAPFAVGDVVYCTVRGQRGIPNTITAVKRGYIKVRGFNLWCPMSNFQREPN